RAGMVLAALAAPTISAARFVRRAARRRVLASLTAPAISAARLARRIRRPVRPDLPTARCSTLLVLRPRIIVSLLSSGDALHASLYQQNLVSRVARGRRRQQENRPRAAFWPRRGGKARTHNN